MMNRREFLRGVLLGAAALVLPKGGGERGGESEITGKRGPLAVVDRWRWPEHENCRCAVDPTGQHSHLLRIDADDDADADWGNCFQPQSLESLDAGQIEEYIEQMRQVGDACMAYLRGAV